jgi:hypothetical protein
MENLDLCISQPAIGRPSRLTARRIRRDDFVQLAEALIEDHDSNVINKLHALVDAVKHNATDDEIDALVGDIEDAAHMDDPAVDLTEADLGQLEFQAAAAQSIGGTVTALPQQPERRRSA